MTNTTTIENLTKTRAILTGRGRATGVLVRNDLNGQGPCCLLGAVGLAVYGDEWHPDYISLEPDTAAGPTISALSKVVENLYDDSEDMEVVWRFNDRNKIEHGDLRVLDAIDRAIAAELASA